MSTPGNIERKLAAIVFTDIAGFTNLSAENEPAALELLETQREILKPIVESHGGNWLKEIGDGLLLSFNTNIEAVTCAIAIQNAVKDIKGLTLRIGIHQGEVVFQGRDVVGDDVNIASRLEPFAAEGGIAISGRVNASLERDPKFETKFLCKPELKGVKQKVEIFCITSHGLPETDLSQTSAKLETEKKFNWNVYSLTGLVLTIAGVIFWISLSFFGVGTAEENEVPSVAILPLDNKGSEEDEFYAYGISSDLISDVTSAGLIRVASLKEVEELGDMPFKEKAKKLFVRFIAQGTIWKRDSIFQLSMELYDTKTERIIWSERWQKNWDELSVIRNVLAENILDELKVDHSVDGSSYAADPAAYEYYLKGKHKYYKRKTLEDKKIAVQLLEKAVEIDENFLEAKRFTAFIPWDEGDSDKAIEVILDVLDQAEKIDDSKVIKGCLNSLGFCYNNSGQYEKAEPYLLRLIEIAEKQNDEYMLGMGYGNLAVTVLNRSNYNIQKIKKAEEYNAKARSIYKKSGKKSSIAANIEFRGNIYRYKGNVDKALENYHQSLAIFIEIDKTGRIISNLWKIGLAYSIKGEFNKAIDYYSRALEIAEKLEEKSTISYLLYYLGQLYSIMKEYEISAEILERSIKLEQEVMQENYEQDMEILSYLYLTYKNLGKDVDEDKIQSLIKENEDDEIDYELNFVLYQLLKEKPYLESAYTQLQEKTERMDKEIKEKYYSYPIPKQIVEEFHSLELKVKS